MDAGHEPGICVHAVEVVVGFQLSGMDCIFVLQCRRRDYPEQFALSQNRNVSAIIAPHQTIVRVPEKIDRIVFAIIVRPIKKVTAMSALSPIS
jgi:vacuolar-type H+-ATPase subunit F/Vma7